MVEDPTPELCSLMWRGHTAPVAPSAQTCPWAPAQGERGRPTTWPTQKPTLWLRGYHLWAGRGDRRLQGCLCLQLLSPACPVLLTVRVHRSPDLVVSRGLGSPRHLRDPLCLVASRAPEPGQVSDMGSGREVWLVSRGRETLPAVPPLWTRLLPARVSLQRRLRNHISHDRAPRPQCPAR